jgi:hypothetical protein
MGAEERQLLLQSIRSTAVAAAETKPFDLSADPAWYEIPAEEKGGLNFSRVFEIDPTSALQNAYEATLGLTIFEFNEEVILSVGNGYVQQHEHPRWTEGLNRLVKLTAKAK